MVGVDRSSEPPGGSPTGRLAKRMNEEPETPVGSTGLVAVDVAAEYERAKLRSMEPKRCPWCRSVKILAEGRPVGDMHRVAMVCQTCLARGPERMGEWHDAPAEARRAWNGMFESELQYELSKVFK